MLVSSLCSQHLVKECVCLGGKVILSCCEYIHAWNSQSQLDREEYFLLQSQDPKPLYCQLCLSSFHIGHIKPQSIIFPISSFHLDISTLSQLYFLLLQITSNSSYNRNLKIRGLEGHLLQPLLGLIVYGGRVIAFSHSNIRYLINQASKGISVGVLISPIASSCNCMLCQRTSASLPVHQIVRLPLPNLFHEEAKWQIRRTDAFSHLLVPASIVILTTKKP